ncbi:MAG: RDD family protein [Luteolibacter sp.]
MQVWIIRNGEKNGPLPDFTVRQGIENGQYTADTPAWHEGLDAWTTLGKIAVFESAFDAPAPEESRHLEHTPPPIRQSTPTAGLHLVRRFWARMVDINIHITFSLLFLYVANFDIGTILASRWLVILLLVSWAPIEAILIHFHGTTPGKWLLGIRVCNEDESPLSRKQSAWRAFRVVIAGLGLGLPYVMPLCLIISYWITRRIGRTIWDHLGGHRVIFRPIRLTRYFAVAGVLLIVSHLQVAVIAPYIMPVYQEAFPSMREHFEKNPPRHFPPRHAVPQR